MIWRIAKKELLLNLMTFKFAVGTVLCVVLMAVFTYVLLGDYQQRLESYNKAVAKNADELRQVRVYKNIKPTIYRPPEVLSIFSEGVEKQLGNSVKIELSSVPEISAGYAEDNPLLSIFPSLDVLLIFKIVLSVLALLLAYDIVSGEKEQGTLRLMLSGTVPRHQVLLGKLVAGLLILAIPITMAFIVGLLILQLSPMVSLTGSDWARIGLIYLVSLIFISAMFNFGLLFSCLTKKSSTTLMFVLFFWVIFVVVIPNASLYLAPQFRPVESAEKIDGEVKALWDKAKAELEDFYRTLPPGGAESDGRGAWGEIFVVTAERRAMERKQKEYAFEEPLRVRYADKVWEVQRRYFNSLTKQKHLTDNLSRSSPISLYGNAMSTLSGTGLGSFENFVKGAKIYRNEVIEYLRSKTESFSSPSHFSIAEEEDVERYTKAIQPVLSGLAKGEYLDRLFENLKKWIQQKEKDSVPLDLRDFPGFTYKPETAAESIGRALLDLALLIFVNVLFFLLSFVAFLRYDVR
ncbi:MAG: ABC transporter permease subunit [Candidatus Latescibacteria bacterium]|nr:ABC transporter permease subunit [Candidatus Latescibacterota bacterium]